MRFNSQAYDKVFPRTVEKERVETAVETFRPSEEPEVDGVLEEPEVVEPSVDEEPSTGQGGDIGGVGNAGELDNE